MEISCEKCKCIPFAIVTTYICYENQSLAHYKLNSGKVTDLFQPFRVDRHLYPTFCPLLTFSIALDWTGHMSFLTGQDPTPKFAGQVLPDRTKSGLMFLNMEGKRPVSDSQDFVNFPEFPDQT